MLKTLSSTIRENPVLRSSLAVVAITLLGKFIGYGEKITLAYYFGTSYKVDVYNLIFTIVLSVFLLVREIIEPPFLNPFLKAIQKRDEHAAWGLFGFFFKWILIFTAIISGLACFFPQSIILVFAPGFNEEKRQLAVKLITIAFPACIFLSLSALTNITLNGLKYFAQPALAELAFKITVLAGLILLYQWFDIYAITAGIIVGALIKLLLHFLVLYRKISLHSLTAPPSYLQDAWTLSWPLLLGVSFSQASSLIDNLFASYLQEGAISALSYSKKIIDLPVLIFPYIVSIVAFPYFSELRAASKKDESAQLLVKCLSFIVIVFLPLSLFFYLFSIPIVELLFKRGAFDMQSVILTAQPLRYYAWGLVFFAVETVLVIFYFANSNTRTPVFTGILCVILNIFLTYLFIRLWGYYGIAIALVISKGLKNVILLLKLRVYLDLNFEEIGVFLIKALAACLLTFAALQLFTGCYPLAYESAAEKAVFLAAAFFLMAVVYSISLFLLRLNPLKT